MPTQTLVIPAGQSAVLPPGAVITAMLYDGEVTAESTCDNLPDPENYKCGVFYFNIDDDDNDNHPMDEDSTIFYNVQVGEQVFDMSTAGLVREADLPIMNSFISSTSLFQFTYVNRYTIDDNGGDANKRQAVYIYFKVPESLYDTLFLGIKAHDNEVQPTVQYYKPHAEVTCGVYTEY